MKFLKLMLAVLVLTPMVAKADTILVRGKPAISGVKVTKETMKEVAYTKGSKKQTIAASEVIAIVYDRPPVNYRIGHERFSLGDYVNAIARLKPAVSEGASDQPWVKPYGMFYLGRAQLAQGQFKDGASTLSKLLGTAGDHRLYPQIAHALARCQSLEGMHDQAKSTLMKLKNVLEQNGLKGLAMQRAHLALGEAYMEAKKFSLAQDALKAAASLGSGKTGLEAQLAYTAKGLLVTAHLKNKDLPKAKIVFDDLKSAARKDRASANAAYRDASVAMLLHGDGSGQTPEAKELLEAAMQLSRVRGENFAVVSEMPRNCYLLGLIHLKLDSSLSKSKELAKGYFEETRRLYPESREAFLAREELKNL